jgi:hypothetical protein
VENPIVELSIISYLITVPTKRSPSTNLTGCNCPLYLDTNQTIQKLSTICKNVKCSYGEISLLSFSSVLPSFAKRKIAKKIVAIFPGAKIIIPAPIFIGFGAN